MKNWNALSSSEPEQENSMLGINVPKGRVGKLVAAYSLAIALHSTFSKIKTFIENKRRLSVTISSRDPIYTSVLEWLAKDSFGSASKEVALISQRSYDDFSESNDVSGLRIIHDAHSYQKIMVRGHKVMVQIEDGENPHRDGANRTMSVPKVVFVTYKKEAHAALITELSEMHVKYQREIRPPKLYSPSGWGGFHSSEGMSPRSLDSVILKDDELDFLIGDLDTFLNSEAKYARLGIPWHRGYLFYGVVGTGKTSIAKALAAHFGLDVFFLPLGDLKKDADLSKLLSDIRPRSILLLEDIDVFSAATSREAESEELSLSGLLNALDGVTTPHGLIKILTTNHIERLDDALIRTGRVDVRQEFTLLDHEQGARLFRHFYNYDLPVGYSFTGMAPSDVVGIFKQHLDDPDTALSVLKELSAYV